MYYKNTFTRGFLFTVNSIRISFNIKLPLYFPNISEDITEDYEDWKFTVQRWDPRYQNTRHLNVVGYRHPSSAYSDAIKIRNEITEEIRRWNFTNRRRKKKKKLKEDLLSF